MAAEADDRFALTCAVVEAGLSARAYPAVSIEVGRREGPVWRHAAGRLTYAPEAAPVTTETIFDLASLTKVIATTSAVMQHLREGRLDLDAPTSWYLPDVAGAAWESATARHLLEHASGLPAHARIWEHARGRDAYLSAMRAIRLDRAPGTSSVYSDLGFMLLGFLLDTLGDPLRQRLRTLADELGAETLEYCPGPQRVGRTAPTEFDPWRNRLLIGEVHDENAAALDGVGGHAGVFGTARDVGAFARLVLRTFDEVTSLGDPEIMRRFARRSNVPQSSRAFGWDTMLPTSSCGTRLSPTAIGHTGFTGTSLWIDWEQDLYVVLLTNRVFPTRDNDAIRTIRPKVHDAVVEDLRRS